MNFSSSTLEKVVEELSRFPGIGKKSALRMTLFLLRSDEQVVRSMTDAILAMKERTTFCSRCGNISEAELCQICNSVNRRQDTICVVRDFQDVLAIENTSRYNGLYHVLGGLISPMQGIGPSDIRIEQLLNRVKTEPVQELILALSANMEGETTEFYISRKLEGSAVQISSIARGIAVGGELEYADEITLGRSIVNRIPYRVKSGE